MLHGYIALPTCRTSHLEISAVLTPLLKVEIFLGLFL